MKAYVDLGGVIAEVDVTLGFVEAVEEAFAHGKVSALKKLKRWVRPPEAVDDPRFLLSVLREVMPKVKAEFDRIPRVGGSGPRANVKIAASSLKYALGSKGVPPRDAESMEIEEVVDFLVILAAEAEEIKKASRARPSPRYLGAP